MTILALILAGLALVLALLALIVASGNARRVEHHDKLHRNTLIFCRAQLQVNAAVRRLLRLSKPSQGSGIVPKDWYKDDEA